MAPVKHASGAQIDVGSEVAGYRLTAVLGVGGSGTVYRAERDGAVVALKLLNAEHAHDEGERARFAREADVVRRLAHPHVVSLIDYGFAGHLPYLVFPFLEGRTLEKRIAAQGKIGWGLTGRFSEQALSALEVAHAMGIAHRDIKPANIFCCQTPSGESIRLLDFGTAKIVKRGGESGSLVTRAGMLIGTPRYMAPEQARGEELTPAADIYAFGLVMAEMLLGRPLVTGAADLDIYVMQGSDRPHELPEDVRYSPFATIIERAVAKPLDVRYRLASQMLADVRAILARFGRGAATPLPEADLEVTRFIGIAAPVSVPESAEKLRKVFNAMANKAAGDPPPAPAAPPLDAGAPAPVAAAIPGAQPPTLGAPTHAPPTLGAPTQVEPPTPLLGAEPPTPLAGAEPPTPLFAAVAPPSTSATAPAAPPVHSPAAPTPAAGAEALGSPSSRTPVFVLIGLLVLAVLGAGVVYVTKKRAASGGDAPEAATSASASARPTDATSASTTKPSTSSPSTSSAPSASAASKREGLASTSPAARAAACASLAKSPATAPLDSIASAAKGDADASVRTQCFDALTSLWVRTSPADPREDAYDAMLAILEAKPRERAHLPEGLGRIGDARLSLPADDVGGIAWAKKVKAFYDQKRVADALEEIALDTQSPLELRRAALKAIGAVADKERRRAVKKKVAQMSDADSRELVADPKAPDAKKAN